MGVTLSVIANMKADALPTLGHLKKFATAMGFGMEYLVGKDSDFVKEAIPLTKEYIASHIAREHKAIHRI